MDAILYVDRTGIAWRYLPHDFPPWETVYGYFAAWQKEGIFDQLNGLLRRLVREAEGRDSEPTACVLDHRRDSCPATTSPALSYTAICSQLPISGRVVAG
jgi:transposase